WCFICRAPNSSGNLLQEHTTRRFPATKNLHFRGKIYQLCHVTKVCTLGICRNEINLMPGKSQRLNYISGAQDPRIETRQYSAVVVPNAHVGLRLRSDGNVRK